MISGILSSLSRLSIKNVVGTARNITTNTNPLCFKATESLWAEPMKKKRKTDPAVLKRRVERKARKIEKSIRRLEKISKSLKPVLELEIPPVIFREKNQRLRKLPPVSPEVAEERLLLLQEWSYYKLLRYREDFIALENVRYSQKKALDELREESEDLYQEAIQCDLEYIPLEIRGPTITPPIENYRSPDGDYIDVTKKYEGE